MPAPQARGEAHAHLRVMEVGVLGRSRFARETDGLATIEYVIGAAVILGTLVIGVSSWNQGLVSRLQALVAQLSAVR